MTDKPQSKRMIVRGTEITQAQLDACVARMKAGPFRSRDIWSLPEFDCVHVDQAKRIAGRIRQQYRRNLRVQYYGVSWPNWTWIWKD